MNCMYNTLLFFDLYFIVDYYVTLLYLDMIFKTYTSQSRYLKYSTYTYMNFTCYYYLFANDFNPMSFI